MTLPKSSVWSVLSHIHSHLFYILIVLAAILLSYSLPSLASYPTSSRSRAQLTDAQLALKSCLCADFDNAADKCRLLERCKYIPLDQHASPAYKREWGSLEGDSSSAYGRGEEEGGGKRGGQLMFWKKWGSDDSDRELGGVCVLNFDMVEKLSPSRCSTMPRGDLLSIARELHRYERNLVHRH
eukprot:GHVQ01023637.1.p1 GENE.GHVQ01023637.1~~GHVQ01023637.1.p1  ORF type:complete len:183 (+),score=27.65 GHVQ01023637.1:236-784(+)